MTYLEKFRLEQPEYADLTDDDIIRRYCISKAGGDGTYCSDHPVTCKGCWNREIPENEEQKTEQPANHDQIEEPVINLVVVAMEAVYCSLITFGVSKEKAHEIVITAMCDTISDEFDRKVGYGE